MLKKYKELLLRKKTKLRDCLRSMDGESKPIDLNTPIGRLSRMDAMQHQQLNLETKRKTEQTLLKIKSALQRIEDGEYGLCLGCGDQIPTKRLDASPETPLCVDCQSSVVF